MDFAKLNLRSTGQFDFELFGPNCATGSLFVTVDPSLKAGIYTEDLYGIRSSQCRCELTDAQIALIEGECRARTGSAE